MSRSVLSSLSTVKRVVSRLPVFFGLSVVLAALVLAAACSPTAAPAPAPTATKAAAPAAPAPTVAPKATTAPAPAPTVAAKTSDFTIVLSNSYLGNAWRKTMVSQFEEAAKEAVAKGLIKSYSVQNTAQNAATQQIGQIQSLILQKPSAIVLNPASQTALDPVIEEACKAGIIVISFDSLVDAKCAYTMTHDFTDFGYRAGKAIAEKLGGKGNILEVRGVTGSAPDAMIHEGFAKVLKEYPGLKLVGTIQGEASQTTTAQALQGLLPSLPQIDGVFNQGGGDAQGVVQAFENARRAIPLVVLDGGGNALQWYQEQNKKTGYETFSLNSLPSQSTIALWGAVELLHGNKVPQHLDNLPPLVIDAKNLDAFVKATPPDGIASPVYSREDARKLFDAALAGTDLPLPPNPR
jgi:ribose transport system substrate-binding protein